MIWHLLIGFVAGVGAWHICGSWLIKRLGLHDQQARAVMRKMSHDALVKLHSRSGEEIQRRKSSLRNSSLE